ncbi:MAG: YceI family protein [Ignavibacteriales bacterium]
MRSGRGRVVRCLAAPLLALALAGPALAITRDAAQVPAGTYVLDKKHGSLTVKVRHMGLSNYTARFNVIDAKFDYDPKNPLAAHVEATVDVNSLDTGEPQFGPQFAREFLDAEHHPTATFVSTKLTAIDATRGVMEGNLTLRGVTKPVKLNVAFDGYTANALAGQRVGFTAAGEIDRTEFGSKFLSPDTVADHVEIYIEAEFLKQ